MNKRKVLSKTCYVLALALVIISAANHQWMTAAAMAMAVLIGLLFGE